MDENKNPFQSQETNTDEINETNNETIDNENEEIDDTKQSDKTDDSLDDSTEKNNEYQQKYEELNNKYIRLAADFDNFRKRTAQEKEELSKYATIQVLKKLTTVLDTFDRAGEHLKNIEDCKVVKESYEVAHKQLLDTLSKIGLVEIEALGKDFNPEEHEAITQVPTDEYAPDTVALVAQKGYKLDDKIVRPALVGVAKEKEEE